ncbi:hypothetical protein GCM10010441_44890 [Kitasatospora paracochleata]|uniref:Uncharacterized protein n=1 Tax=Kitasatospora paracochleata TaxID=58354 RepID=A0ABT1JBL2_9ACTN|nr:hypothetical protein [Kitasatospora paracochleata]MCP2314066.1 hypothetical protein [Kitasatospora paracochleata]
MTTAILPTDASELAALLRRIPAGEWPDVDDLAARLGDSDRAFKIFSEAESEVQRGNEIDALRATLNTALTDAQANLRAAEHTIGRLASNGVYDIEYAESTTNADLQHLLSDASRAVRIALVLKQRIDN